MDQFIYSYNFKKKYFKYKQKYLNLQKQNGGLDVYEIIKLIKNKENLITFIDKIKPKIESKLVSTNFLSTTNFSTYDFSDDIDDFLLYFMYTNNEIPNNAVFNFNGTNYCNNINVIIEVSKYLYKYITDIIEYNELNNSKTILLIPGDSPFYMFYIIKLLYPELLSKNITIVEFPISSLGKSKIVFVDNEFAILDYFVLILQHHIHTNTLAKDDKFVIIDYIESGDSVKFITNHINKIYENNGIYLNDSNFLPINVIDFFLTSEIIKEYNEIIRINKLSDDNHKNEYDEKIRIENNKLITDANDLYDVEIDKINKKIQESSLYIDKLKKYNDKKEKIINDKKKYIKKNKKEILTDINTLYKKRSLPEIRKEYLPSWINFSYQNFPEEYPIEYYNYYNIYQFISDGDYTRCQYQLHGYDIKNYIDRIGNLNNIDDFIKEQNDTVKKPLIELHKSCNLFLYFLNLYIKNKEIITEKTNILSLIFM